MSSKTGSSSVSPACGSARIERLSPSCPTIRYSEKLPSSSQPAQTKRCFIAFVSTLLRGVRTTHLHSRDSRTPLLQGFSSVSKEHSVVPTSEINLARVRHLAPKDRILHLWVVRPFPTLRGGPAL